MLVLGLRVWSVAGLCEGSLIGVCHATAATDWECHRMHIIGSMAATQPSSRA